jgi:pyruvate dehydrogenase E2 component (dihydrolipoamide acetyltransferase)
MTYLQNRENAGGDASGNADANNRVNSGRLLMASPKARRLAAEQGKDLAAIKGTGPAGAVLAADVLAANGASTRAGIAGEIPEETDAAANGAGELAVGNIWRIMAERTTQGWTSIPHFYLVREVNASRLVSWREQLLKRSTVKVTYTDLLVKITSAALGMHPRVNASWNEGKISLKEEINIGLAVAVEEGLVVPVIQRADTLGTGEIAGQRVELVAKAQAGKLRPKDISGGTFTISNLGMYNVDAFNAIINQPQAAILAVGRITERVVPVGGQPAVRPMMVLTLSCDHRVVDGARGAQFLDTIATLIEEPLGLLG